jgi:hypothetical protein
MTRNRAWGVATFTFPDTETPPADVSAAGAACRGGVATGPPVNLCVFDDWGNAVVGNTFSQHGSFGNASNGDFGEVTTSSHPTNCFRGNVEQGGGQVTSSPAGLQHSKPACDGHNALPDVNLSMTNQLICDTQAFSTPCPPGSSYPQATGVKMLPLPSLPTMPDPCAGVPANPWCGGTVTTVAPCARARAVRVHLTVALGERLRAVTVRVGRGRSRTFSAAGSAATTRLDLGDGRGRVKVSFVERIKVGHHIETVRFSRVYRRC